MMLGGCHAVPAAAFYAGIGLLTGELKVVSATLDYLAAKRGRPPDCSPAVPPPCVMMPPSNP